MARCRFILSIFILWLNSSLSSPIMYTILFCFSQLSLLLLEYGCLFYSQIEIFQFHPVKQNKGKKDASNEENTFKIKIWSLEFFNLIIKIILADLHIHHHICENLLLISISFILNCVTSILSAQLISIYSSS